MDTRYIKILFAAASLAFTVYLFIIQSWGAAIGMLFVTAVLVLINFRSIRLIVALFQLRKQNFAKAKTWINRANPEKLWPKQKGYWHFLSGLVTMQENLNTADKHFRQALKAGLNMDHDKAMAKLNMAVVAAQRQKKREAISLLKEAKRLDKRGMMKNEIKQVEQAIKNPRVMHQRARR